MKSSVFLMLLFTIFLSSCTSTEPYYGDRWINRNMSAQQVSLASDECVLEQVKAVSEYDQANPRRNSNSWVDAANNLADSVERTRVRDLTYQVCMRRQGFSLEQVCVANCGL